MGNKELKQRILTIMKFDGWVTKSRIVPVYNTPTGAPKNVDIDFYVKGNRGVSTPFDTSYQSSYDSLMPVWVKFRELEAFTDSGTRKTYYSLCDEVKDAIADEGIEDAFIALSNAIIWYNSIKE